MGNAQLSSFCALWYIYEVTKPARKFDYLRKINCLRMKSWGRYWNL